MTGTCGTSLAGLLLAVLISPGFADDAAAPPQEAAAASSQAAGHGGEGTAPSGEGTAEASEETSNGDWTYWRGPQWNGNSTLTNLPESWDPEGGEGSNLLWKREDLGSRSTPVVMGNRLYTLCRDKPETREEGEKIVCVDIKTGETVWEQRWNVYLSDVPDTRIGWSSVVADPESNQVYCLGVQGLLSCFTADTGEPVWQRSMHEEYGLLSTYGGRTNFPIVYEDLLIVSAVIIGWGEQAKPTHRYIAFDKYNGQPVWFEGTRPFPEDTTYSAPVLGTFNGEVALVFGAGDGGIYSFQPRTGKMNWSYMLSERGINTSPVIYKDTVICGHSEENIGSTKMGGLVCLNGADGTEIWKNLENFVGKSPPIIAEDLLIACEDKGTLMVLDPTTGKELHRRKVDTVMRGSPLYADGKLYVLSANGRWWIFRIKSEGEGENRKVELEEVHRMRLNRTSAEGSPIAAHGRIFLPTSDALYCIGTNPEESTAGEIPQLLNEKPKEDATPALVQVVPVESLLFPGQKQRFDVRLYNAAGQWIRNADADEVTFSVEAVGAINADGRFSSDASLQKPAAAIVSARFGDLEGKARIRVIPNLPWSFDFEEGEVPEPWVGMRYRHVTVDFDLVEQLAKEDRQAEKLYIYFASEFTNFGPTRTYDDSTPAQRWTEVLRFLNMLGEGDRPKTPEEAQEKFTPALNRLKELGVLKSFEWSTWDRESGEGETIQEPRLTVVRGEREEPGNSVMCKITTIPKGTRSQGWIGHPSIGDYTIQADVYSTRRTDDRLPDIGLVAQRYTLDLQGAAQKLQIRTWPPQLRMAQTVDFAWEPETWYTMKFRAANEDGKAVLRGKVWKRGEDEPAEWTVVAEDTVPNVVGSPGFYGNAKDAEIFYDNVVVSPNQAEMPSRPEAATEAASGEGAASPAESPEKEAPDESRPQSPPESEDAPAASEKDEN